MTNRRHFLAILTGLSGAATSWAACSGEAPPFEDELEGALAELNDAAGIGIAAEDFERARSYAAGAYREAARSLRPLALDPGLDLPVAFAAKRESR
jgi:hypothetical protein